MVIIVSSRAGAGEMWSIESKGLGSEVVYCSTVPLLYVFESNLMNQQNNLMVKFPGPSKPHVLRFKTYIYVFRPNYQ